MDKKEKPGLFQTRKKKPEAPAAKERFDPKEQAIKYKAYRHIFTDRDIQGGLDEKTLLRKIKKSNNLAGRYQQYLELIEDESRSGRIYPWQNPFNKVLFWTAFWVPRFFKWSFFLCLFLFVINYIPGPTQHIVEIFIARSVYDTASISRLPTGLDTYAHSAKILDQQGLVIKSYGKRSVTEKIPPNAQIAILACEDHYLLPHPGNPWYVNGFLIHPGVSWLNLVGAAMDTVRGNTRGASTIVMQNAKKILGNTDRTIANKLEEIILSYMMVSKFGKEANLDFYINTVPVGANIYGLPAAASNYFKKDLAELNMQQLVAIGSFIPNHNRQIAFYEIINGKTFSELDEDLRFHAKSAINKINLALRYLREHEEISAEKYKHWVLTDEESIRRIGFRDFRSPLYGEEEWTSWNVIKEVTSRSYRVNGREISGTQLILDEKGDVVIETAVDIELVEKIKGIISEYLQSPGYQAILQKNNARNWEEEAARQAARGGTPPFADFNAFMEHLNRQINVGVIIINQQGEIIAYVGGKEFLQRETEGESKDTETSPRVIIDLMNKKAKVTPSSTIKPIIAYYAMVENNTKLQDTFTDKPLEYKYSESAGRQIWLPGNWYDYDGKGMGNNRYLGRNYTLFDAQVISINTIFARLYTDRKLRDAMLMAFDEVGLEYSKEDAKYWPFGIGASDVSVQQWLGIYNAFLDGKYRPPAFVSRITINGEAIYTRKDNPAMAPLPFFDAKKEREEEMRVLYEICNTGTASSMDTEFKYHGNLVTGKTGTAPEGKSSLFVSHFNPYRNRAGYSDKTYTMLVSATTNAGGKKSVGTSAQGPVKIAGRIYDHLFRKELQEMMDSRIEKAKKEDQHFGNNHLYWANVNRYMDHLLNNKCDRDFVYKNMVGVDAYGEALNQILNSTNRIYTGKDNLFYQLVQYYCDREKVVKMNFPRDETTEPPGQTE